MKYEPLIEDTYYHIYNCGNNKENLFIEEGNYSYFLKLKKKPNIESKKISQQFSNLFNVYAKAINNKYNRTGSLFKDRFSRIKIKNEDYLKSLIVYIHTNPVHHNIIDDFKKYKQSSYSSLISKKATLLNRDFVINLFEDVNNFEFVHKKKQLNIIEELVLE